MAVTAAPAGQDPGMQFSKAVDWQWQSAGESESSTLRCERASPFAHSTGTTISLARTMLSRLRAAASMVRGSLRSCSTSSRNDWLPLRKAWTSVCIRTYCSEAAFILVRVRIVTVTQTANVARMIMPKITQDGMIPPRRRTSARVPIMSNEISRTGAKGEAALGATRCERIRSSTQ
jgi:hypothetical protein